MSRRMSSYRDTYSERDYEERRHRLRSGAIVTSRSRITGTEVQDEKIVNVGEGVKANIYEQLLARLEQHGLRRCFVEDADEANLEAREESGDDATIVDDDGRLSLISGWTYGNPCTSESRSPYYYMCVPCEMKLTATCTTAATLRMLQDAHYHFSSAKHRCEASWMGEQDIDRTLNNSAEVDVNGYMRIYVNGIPMLLPRRPGGGDMFYPLPHEEFDYRDRATSVGRDGHLHTIMRRKEYWYRPLQSIFTGTKQLVYSADSRVRLRTKKTPLRFQRRNGVVILHVPMDTYAKESFVDGPTVPALFQVDRKRMPKVGKNETSDGYRVAYVASKKPMMVWNEKDARPTALNRTVVSDGDIYRVALIHADVAKALLSGEPVEEPDHGVIAEDNEPATLTLEALRRIGAISSVVGFGSRSGSPSDSRSDSPSDSRSSSFIIDSVADDSSNNSIQLDDI
ncbi:hypothetical protein ERJ75_000204600 [Trypanosoma vivax]|uniref:Uncharacterized protein n=1 Tax=Trypanosoma vivax (strain Y486) TaxID=1055687 RepID=G0UA22_TRYVY|nr:hypothetical protein TRVL_06220 [Trypanosoma vivax]KAH8619009.1 hypothetical protein ERJ75_000204600 [Trypanosoma vivax]CCC52653.1 conserved hypothetical protein [Trypanosoma vivax Y486]